MNTAEETTVFCPACGGSHPARLTRDGERVLGLTDCPLRPEPVPLTDDAELFLDQRERVPPPAAGAPRFQFAQIYITQDCDCDCPVCYRAASPDKAAPWLSVPEILRRARQARALGIRRVLLIGGEPTTHPELPAVLRELRRAGCVPGLATNGLAFARKPELAAALKRAGLARVDIQFDTLDAEILHQLRGHRRMDLKTDAIHRIAASGLPFMPVATIAPLNLHETGTLIRWAFALPVPPTEILFQNMVPVGRFPAGLGSVTREAIIRSIVASGAIPGATAAHFHPTPVFLPAGLMVHPDCGSILIARRDRNAWQPADRTLDLTSIFRDLARVPAARGCWTPAILAAAVFRHTRRGGRLPLARALWRRLRGRPDSGLMSVIVASFCNTRFVDEARLTRCGNCILTAAGPESICGYFARHPGASPCALPLANP